MTLVLLTALALASPSRHGVLPSASPIDFAGHASVSGGVGTLCLYECMTSGGFALNLAIAPTDDVVFHVAFADITNLSWLPFAALAVRADLVKKERFRLSTFVTATGRLHPPDRDDRRRDVFVGLSPGLALETGGDRVLFDMSYAPVMFDIEDRRRNPYGYRGTTLQLLPLLPDIGVSFLGPKGRSRFRLSLTLPSWTYTRKKWWVTVSGAPTLIANVLVIEAGIRW